MIANFFKKTKPIDTILIGGLFTVFYLLKVFLFENESFTVLLLFEKVAQWAFFLGVFVLIKQVINTHGLTAKNSYAFLLFVLLLGIFPQTIIFNKQIISQCVVFFAFIRILSISDQNKVNQKLFDASLLLGIATAIYMWNVVFLILVYTSIILYKRIGIRALLIPIIGFLLPLLFFFVYSFLVDASDHFLDSFVFEYSLSFQSFRELGLAVITTVLLLLVMISIGAVRFNFFVLDNNFKSKWPMVVLYFYSALCIVLLTPYKSGEELIFIFFPTVIIITNFLQILPRRFLKELIVFSMLILAFTQLLSS